MSTNTKSDWNLLNNSTGCWRHERQKDKLIVKCWYMCALAYIAPLNQMWRLQHVTQCNLLHVSSLGYDGTKPYLISTIQDKATATYKSDKNKSVNFTYQIQIPNMIHLGDKYLYHNPVIICERASSFSA